MMPKIFKKYPKFFWGAFIFIASFATLFYPAYQYVSQRYFESLPPPTEAQQRSGGEGAAVFIREVKK